MYSLFGEGWLLERFSGDENLTRLARQVMIDLEVNNGGSTRNKEKTDNRQ